jgi:hypothetical protein
LKDRSTLNSKDALVEFYLPANAPKILWMSFRALLRSWMQSIFATAKKIGSIRVNQKFQLVTCHPFPIPKIGDITSSMEGFSFVTALDINMEILAQQIRCRCPKAMDNHFFLGKI